MSSLQIHALRSFSSNTLRYHMSFLETFRTYSSTSGSSQEEEFAAARDWYRNFSKSTIPTKIAETSFSRSSGPGGQKVNKTSSKATTTWPLHSLLKHIPKALHQSIKDSRYYVSSSDSLNIQCDTGRSQTANKEECHSRLHEEIEQIYKKKIPGITSLEQKKRVDSLKKAENAKRLQMKKMHGDKKKARSKGGDSARD